MNYDLASIAISCPYCGETIDILADESVAEQSYIEDCSVCCRPIEMNVRCGGEIEVDAQCSD